MDGSIIDMLTFKRTKYKQSASIFSAPCFSLLFLNCGPLWWPLQALCVQKIANVSISPLCCRQSIHHSCTLQRTRMVGGGLPDCRVWLQDIITTWRVLCVLWTNGTHHVFPLDIHLCFVSCAYAHISAYDELKKRILHAVYADIYICRKPHMGQFVQGGKNGRLMSYFFKSRASVWPNLMR